MGSYNEGKLEVVEWVKQRFPKGSTCLDVGVCDGKWFNLLGDYLKMDCVEIFKPIVADAKVHYNFCPWCGKEVKTDGFNQ